MRRAVKGVCWLFMHLKALGQKGMPALTHKALGVQDLMGLFTGTWTS